MPTKEDVKKIHSLIETGEVSNLELAIQLGKAVGYNTRKYLKQQYGELIEFLISYGDKCFRRFSLIKKIIYIQNVTELELDSKDITHLPNSINKLKSLEMLSVEFNKISIVPDSIGDLVNLERLYLCDNQIKNIPDSITNLSKLYALDLTINPIFKLPILKTPTLQFIFISDDNFPQLEKQKLQYQYIGNIFFI